MENFKITLTKEECINLMVTIGMFAKKEEEQAKEVSAQCFKNYHQRNADELKKLESNIMSQCTAQENAVKNIYAVYNNPIDGDCVALVCGESCSDAVKRFCERTNDNFNHFYATPILGLSSDKEDFFEEMDYPSRKCHP